MIFWEKYLPVFVSVNSEKEGKNYSTEAPYHKKATDHLPALIVTVNSPDTNKLPTASQQGWLNNVQLGSVFCG